MELRTPSNIIFDELTHSYLCGDKVLTGITTMMSHQGLSDSYDGIDPEVLGDAAKRGTYVHNLFEDYDNGMPTIPTDVISDYDPERVILTADDANALLKAYKKLRLNVLHSEFLVSDCNAIASFIDKVIGTDEPNTVDLGDVKTTSSFHNESVSWQLSFYAVLFELFNPDIKVRRLVGIHARNGKVKEIEVPRKDPELCWQYINAEARGEVLERKEELQSAEIALTTDELTVYLEIERAIASFNAYQSSVKAMHEELKAKIYNYMLENNVDELSAGSGKVKLKRPYTTERLDTTKLKKEHPALAKKYTKTSEVKGSITFNS